MKRIIYLFLVLMFISSTAYAELGGSGIFGGTGAGNVAADAIWDAKGDLAVGTGANTAAKLAIGTAYQVLHVNNDTPGWTSTLGATGTRLTKGWFTDLEITNAPTINGAAWTTILQPLDGELTALAGLTSAANAIPYFTGSGTAGVISSSANMVSLLGSSDYETARSNLGVAIGSDVQAHNDDLDTLSAGGTAGCVWGEKSDSSGIECKTSINLQIDDSAAQFKSATASKGTLKFDQTGIADTKLVTVKFTSADDYTFNPTLLGNVSLLVGTTFTDTKYCTYSTSTGLTCAADGGGGAGDLKADGSVAMTAALVPNAANTVALGSAAAEWADIYFGDGAIIYGQNDQSNTITSSATGWAFAKPITTADVANDNFLKITNNTARAATADVNEIYPEGNVWKVNQNGTESSVVIGATEEQIKFSGTLTNGKYCTYATGGAISCNSDGGGLAADGSVAMTGALVPNAVNTIALGSASAEWADIYLGDSAVIYGENDSSNTITSSATGWAFAKAISATSVSTTAGASTGGYLRLLEGSNNGTDYSMITGIADAGTTAAFTFGGSSTTENVILTIPATTSTEATVTSTSGITSINFSAIQVRDTKVITADTDNEAMGATSMGRIWTNTGDADGTVFTLPEASTVLGQSVTFAVTVAQNLDVNPNDGTDQIMGLTNAAGDAVRCATIGCTLTLTAVTANMWMVTSSYGTWSDVN